MYYQSIKLVVVFGIFAFLLPVVSAQEIQSLGDAWSSIKSSLIAAENSNSINEALTNYQNSVSVYQKYFKDAAQESEHRLIQDAFSNIEQSLNVGNVETAKLQRQIVDKTLYKIAFLQIEKSFKENDAEHFLRWYDVIDKKFSLSQKNTLQTPLAVAAIKQDPAELPEYSSVIREEILDIFKRKTIEEIEEAVASLEGDDLAAARQYAYEGLYYYQTLHPAVQEKLGGDKAEKLLSELEEAVSLTESQLTPSQILEEFEEIEREVELLLQEYDGNSTDIASILSGIKDRLLLVEEEYADAVSDGSVVNQEEYDETIIFLNKASEIYEENRDMLSQLSKTDSDSLLNNIQTINRVVTEFGPSSQVSVSVGKALNDIATLHELSGGDSKTDVLEYIDNVQMLLEKAGDEYREGDSQAAFDLVSEAYIDNFEFVEGPLGEVDPELMEKLELDIRENLRDMIQQGADPETVDAKINEIMEDLDVARAVVPEFGTITILILLISIVSVIMFTHKRFMIRL